MPRPVSLSYSRSAKPVPASRPNTSSGSGTPFSPRSSRAKAPGSVFQPPLASSRVTEVSSRSKLRWAVVRRFESGCQQRRRVPRVRTASCPGLAPISARHGRRGTTFEPSVQRSSGRSRATGRTAACRARRDCFRDHRHPARWRDRELQRRGGVDAGLLPRRSRRPGEVSDPP